MSRRLKRWIISGRDGAGRRDVGELRAPDKQAALAEARKLCRQFRAVRVRRARERATIGQS